MKYLLHELIEAGLEQSASYFFIQTLASGDRLPTIRELHKELGVNPNTVAKAYRELALKGLIDGQRGGGRGHLLFQREQLEPGDLGVGRQHLLGQRDALGLGGIGGPRLGLSGGRRGGRVAAPHPTRRTPTPWRCCASIPT